jgi:hypothetical protein
MGRNSVEATKASLIRAVRALRTALLACGWCLRGLFPVVWAVGFVPALPVEVEAFVAALTGVVVFCLGLAVGLGGALCVLAGAEPVGAAACAPADRAAVGNAIISRESRTAIAMQPEASRATEIGEEMALISLL